MMIEKYDDMISQTPKKIMSKKTTFAKTVVHNMPNGGQCNSCKEWNTIVKKLSKSKRKQLEE
jgi:predicted ATP-dependent serine protease